MRVLVIDDDVAIQEFIQFALEDEGHQVRCASNGLVGLAEVAAFAPEVILLDMNMPVMNGWEFARAYAAMESRQYPAPIIVLTAAGDAPERARQLAAMGYLGKPFDLQELTDRVHQIGAVGGGGSAQP